MQKARALRHTEWALKDALRMIQTNSDVPPNIGYQRDPRDFDWDYGCSYEEYYVSSDYSLTRESMEIEVEYILNLYTTHEIYHHEAKRRIVDLL